MSKDDSLEIHGRKMQGLRSLCVSCCSYLFLQTGHGPTDVTRRQHRERTACSGQAQSWPCCSLGGADGLWDHQGQQSVYIYRCGNMRQL